jgi:hypothetical protein
MVHRFDTVYAEGGPQIEWVDEPIDQNAPKPGDLNFVYKPGPGGLGLGYMYNGPMPTIGRLARKTNLRDLFKAVMFTGVSERLRNIIEEIEPKVHQFFPLTILQRSGTPLDEKYFILNIMQKFEARLHFPERPGDVRREKFSMGLLDPYGAPPYLVMGGGTVYSRPKIAGRHLWIATASPGSKGAMSDKMFGRWKKEKIRWFEAFPQKGSYQEIDVAWKAEEQIPETLAWYTNALNDLKAGRDTPQAQYLVQVGPSKLPWLYEDCPSIAPDIAQCLNSLSPKVLP